MANPFLDIRRQVEPDDFSRFFPPVGEDEELGPEYFGEEDDFSRFFPPLGEDEQIPDSGAAQRSEVIAAPSDLFVRQKVVPTEEELALDFVGPPRTPVPFTGLFGIEQKLRRGFQEGFRSFAREWREPVVSSIASMLPSPQQARDLIADGDWKRFKFLADNGVLPSADEIGRDFLRFQANKYTAIGGKEKEVSKEHMALLMDPRSRMTRDTLALGEIPEDFWDVGRVPIVPGVAKAMYHPEEWPAVALILAADRFLIAPAAKEIIALLGKELWTAATLKKTTLTSEQIARLSTSIHDPRLSKGLTDAWKGLSTAERKYIGKMAHKGVPVTVVYPRQRLVQFAERSLYRRIAANAEAAGIEPGTQAAIQHFLETPMAVRDAMRAKVLETAGVAPFGQGGAVSFTVPTTRIPFREVPIALRESPIPSLPAIYKPQGIPSKGAPFPAAQLKMSGAPPKPQALIIPEQSQALATIEGVTRASNYDAPSVKYLLEAGMAPADITANSEVVRDMIFQREMGIPTEEILAGATPDTPALVQQWKRMAPAEGDPVLMPTTESAGTLRRFNNDGTVQVELSSGVKVTVQAHNVIKADGLAVPRRNIEELRAVVPPTASVLKQEFSPTIFASDLLKTLGDDRLLTAITMVGEGEHTAIEAVDHLAFGHQQSDMIKSLAAEIGHEEFLSLATDAVSANATKAVPEALKVADARIRQLRRSIPEVPAQGTQTYSPSDPVAPEPHTVPLSEYLLGNAPPELAQLQNIKRTMSFQVADEKAIDRYINALDRVVSKHMPERYDEFTQTVFDYRNGKAKLMDLDQVYASEVHRRLLHIQFADAMEQMGIEDPMEAGMAVHKQSVEVALANNAPVAPEVLEQYPDLAERYGLKEPEPTLPRTSLEDVRQTNVNAQRQRIEEKGEDVLPAGLQIKEVGPAALPASAKADEQMARAMENALSASPDVAIALNAGDKALGEMSGARSRLTSWRNLMAEVLNPQMDKELRKIMPQYVDDKRTGLYTIAPAAQVQALEDTGALWGDLTKVQRQAVMRMIFLRSFIQTAGEGLGLPHEIPLEEVQSVHTEFESILSQQAPELLKVVDRYQEYMKALSDQMVDRGWLKPQDVKDFYAPHVVIDYTPHYFLDRPYIAKAGRQPFQPYLQKREGTARDIYANEEAILGRIAQIHADMAFDDWVNTQLDTYDIAPKMTPEARMQYFGTRPSGRIGTPKPHGLYTVGGKDYRGYQYIPGQMVYTADVVDRSLLAQAFQDAMEDIGMASSPADEKMIEDIAMRGFDAIEKYLMGVGPRGGDALRSVRALGARQRTYLIPAELYTDMNRLIGRGAFGPLTEVSHHLRSITRLWKTMATQVSGGIPFHIGNEMGDLQNMIKTAGVGPLREIPTALKVLRHINDPSKLDPFEQQVRDLVINKDVIGAGFFRELSTMAFRAKKHTEMNAMLKIWHKYQKASAFRELSNRVAMASYQMKRVDRGLPVKAKDMSAKELYGLDMPSQIGYVARNFTVDYGDIPDWYRRHVSGFWFPFATFYQKNTVNWAKLLLTPGKGRYKYIPKAFMESVAIPGSVAYVWNHYGPAKDIEDGLGYYRRRLFHLNLWQWDDDGDGEADRGFVFAPQMPSDMALEMVGADRILENIDYVRRGVLTAEEAAAKQVVDFGFGPLRMGQRLLNPLAGAITDIVRNNNPYTGPVVPQDEEGLPEWEKMRLYYLKHIMSRTLTPMSQYLAEERGDEPPLMGIPWIRRPLDVMAGFGFHTVDLHKETDREWWEMRRHVSADRARQMRKFRTAYVKSGMELLEYVISPEAIELLGETWRKDFAVEPGIQALERGEMPKRGTLIGYLAGTGVQLEVMKKKLTRPGLTKEERIDITNQRHSLLKQRRLQDIERIRKEELPAFFKRILRITYKKIEADINRDVELETGEMEMIRQLIDPEDTSLPELGR